jgi:hypothetical protein
MDLSVTNAWIAVGAISLAVIALAVITALVFVVRAARTVSDSAARASEAIEQVSRQVSPLAAQTSAFLGDVHDLVQQLRDTDTATTAAVERITTRWRQISAVARTGLWPAIAAARGAAALVQWIAGRESSRPDTVDNAADEARFVYEGGEQVRSGAGR